jgi:cytochrome c-type biogenesis protein CcmH
VKILRQAWVAFAITLILTMPAAAIDPTPPLPDAAQDQRYQQLIHEMRCLQCQGETVADTPAQFAKDIRRQVREMVQAGKTNAEVRQYMVDRYGQIILLKPLWSWGNAWLWLAPAVFLIGGVWIALRILRQRQQMLVTDDSVVDERPERS